MTHPFHISPNFTSEKLDAPIFDDLIDVFEDRIRGWLIEPAAHLVSRPDGDVPALALILGYFEAIEIYASGVDSKHASGMFFRRGFQRVFRMDGVAPDLFDRIVDELYAQARCGFAHEGLFRSRIVFNPRQEKSITISWPKQQGQFVPDGKLASAVINTREFIKGVAKHFAKFVAELRSASDPDLRARFQAAVDLKWGLNVPAPIVAQPEEDFYA